jgi:hypothetical protein
VIEEGSLGRTKGLLGGSEDMMFLGSDVGELEGMGTLGDRIGTGWRLEAMRGSCNSTMGLRDGVEECDNGRSREQGVVVGSGDVGEIVGSKGKGMGTSPVEDSCEGRSAAAWSLIGKEVSSKTTWRDKYTLLVMGSRHL